MSSIFTLEILWFIGYISVLILFMAWIIRILFFKQQRQYEEYDVEDLSTSNTNVRDGDIDE